MGQQEEKMLQKFLGEKKFLLAEFSKLIDLKEVNKKSPAGNESCRTFL
ncbi:hypothetical protein G6M26_07965 [Agrobacterium tumefaciens]|nr:hypothetical protein [Agrobacterium tumefaciens]NTE18457.1 hypothetical protein [Agrobacterium tumefaciens]